MGRSLRHGYTTGACAAAAALGAARWLAGEEPGRVELLLPGGERAGFALHGCRRGEDQACCFVVKDAGDDPDITHGVEVHARLERISPSSRHACPEGEVRIVGGEGIGTVTKPGLAVPVGEPAINPVPRRMIEAAVRSVFSSGDFRVTISIPDGEQRARKTLNARLGILGGLSILGTTGVVRPLSHQAWTDTIDVAIDVAQAAGCDRIVASTGRSSETAARSALAELPEEAFVMMGDFVGHLVSALRRKGGRHLVLAAQFAKLLKIACGHEQTHVRNADLDLKRLAAWARQVDATGATAAQVAGANTAREVFLALGAAHPLVALVAERARKELHNRAPGVKIEILLVGYDGEVAGRF
ncbi:cobalt-precorrin-5B (C1)-methyltransferase [Geothermobacter ehrlichii]|uniref:Cobalt-precorrin-5B C(1)-methyltransferase n=1 Tax=Geothermobacter ehrlichii TaxID=213224 RepID=A0A5D3WJR3_9BACT|nr:cobalt-precorrin-5B (C(1))-methyltransferase CbiD [Geothermobacter ehrlichii]TYO98454.1 cobalt-precorrin-5B (C1)-methyltransferase [Geothermobacter ehrlichii]